MTELRLECADCHCKIVIHERPSGYKGSSRFPGRQGVHDPRNEADRRGWKHQGRQQCGACGAKERAAAQPARPPVPAGHR
jgi:hypothetical protein